MGRASFGAVLLQLLPTLAAQIPIGGAVSGTLPAGAAVVPYGVLLVGANPGSTALLLLPFTVPVGTPMPLPVPDDPAMVGLQVGVQTLTFPAGNPALGNLTRMHQMLVRP